jgi:hypothetical protein
MEKTGDDIFDFREHDLPANPKCTACSGHGTVFMAPEAIGWTRDGDHVWTMPDGQKFEFPPHVPELLICRCPACYPSHYPDNITIN